MSGSGSLVSYPFEFNGTLEAGASDSSVTFTLLTPCQSIVYEFSSTQTLGGDEYVTLGTQLTCDLISCNPGVGFGNFLIASISYGTYPFTNIGFSGVCPVTVEVFTGAAPSSGSTSSSINTGTFSPGAVLAFDASGVASAQSISGSLITGAVSVTTPSSAPNWLDTGFPSYSSINNIYGFRVSDSEGIEVNFSIKGTAYYGEVLVLDQVFPTYGQAIPLQGNNLGSICETLLVSQDGGSYVASVGFEAGVNWSSSGGGSGITAEYGTHVLEVKDAVTGVTSNTVTYYLAQGGGGGGGGGGGSGNAECCSVLPSNNLGRWRGACGINWNGLTLIGDAYSGVIGQASFNSFQEYGNTMLALVTSPIIHSGRRRVFVPKVEIDVETGVGNPECCGFDPVWMLDWSKDGGRTWGPLQVFRSMGKIGAYLQRLRWTRLGQGRQWIFRLQSTDPVRRVIISTFVDWYAGMPTISTEE
jgi:hypothetical protein